MTTQEKWDRMTNPQSVEDYGIGIPISELMEVPEVAEELRKYLPSWAFVDSN